MAMDDEDVVPKATHDAAVKAARTEGEQAGATAQVDRFRAILDDKRVEGRETHALTLAIESPGMSADAIGKFVEKLPAASNAGPKVQSVEERAKATGADAVVSGNDPKAERKDDDAKADNGWGDAVGAVNERTSARAASTRR